MSNGAGQQTLTGRELLTSSTFTLTGGKADGGGGSFGALWGRGAVTSFGGSDGPLSLEGEVATGMVGVDWVSKRWLTGLVLAMSRGTGGYSAGVSSGDIKSELTGLYPWVGYHLTDRLSVWAAAGYGAGVLTVTPRNEEELTTKLSMSMVAAGARSEVVKLPQLGGIMLAVETDTRLTRTSTGLEATDASVWQQRLGLEGSRPVTLSGRLSLRPSVEVGLRHDGGDAETGAGMDVGMSLVGSDSETGLAVDVQVRTLLVHQAEEFTERGVAVSLSYNPRPSTPLGPDGAGGVGLGRAGDQRGRCAVGPRDDGGVGAGQRRGRQPAQRRGRLRAVAGELAGGDTAGRGLDLAVRPGLPGGVRPGGAPQPRSAVRAGGGGPAAAECAGGRRQQRPARPGQPGLVVGGNGPVRRHHGQLAACWPETNAEKYRLLEVVAK